MDALVDGAESLLEPANDKLELLLVLGGDQVILTQVFVAAAARVALVEAEHLVDGGLCALLEGDHLAGTRREDLVVGRVLQLSVPLVAWALAGILAAVEAVAERLALGLGEVLPNVVVVDFVHLDVLSNKNKVNNVCQWVLTFQKCSLKPL